VYRYKFYKRENKIEIDKKKKNKKNVNRYKFYKRENKIEIDKKKKNKKKKVKK
jgi:hypothetical protein